MTLRSRFMLTFPFFVIGGVTYQDVFSRLSEDRYRNTWVVFLKSILINHKFLIFKPDFDCPGWVQDDHCARPSPPRLQLALEQPQS